MPPAPVDRRAVVAGAIVLLGFALVAASLVGLVLLGRDDAAGFEVAARPAPPLELTDQDGHPFTLASLAGRPVLVFFGYTHCPDVCPESIGLIGQALAASPAGARAVFVSIDPERDDVAAMKAYLRYLPAAFTGLTGAPDEVRRNADAWSVRYAKEEAEPGSGAYGMSHTSDIFLVDGAGRLRASFPYGTPVEPIEAWLTRLMTVQPAPSDVGLPSPAPSSAPGRRRPRRPRPRSRRRPRRCRWGICAPRSCRPAMDPGRAGTAPSSCRSPTRWACRSTDRRRSPSGWSGRDGLPVGSDVAAVAVRPAGELQVAYVATVDIPGRGSRRLDDRRDLVRAGDGRRRSTRAARRRSVARCSASYTPTLADAGGNLLAISTQPQSDARLYQSSTADARAAGRPYVIVIDWPGSRCRRRAAARSRWSATSSTAGPA